MKPLFDVVLIAKNEEKTLPRLLNSLEEFKKRGGEVFLCDTGSEDKTVEVAKKWGVNVTEVGDKFIYKITKEEACEINKKFIVEGEEDAVKEGDKLFDYSAARNFASTLAKQDMIATPDCDEQYTNLDIGAINQAINNGVEQLEYQFIFAHDEHGKPSIQFLHSKFYNRKKLKWKGIVHEVLTGNAKRQMFSPQVILLEHFQNQETNRGGYLKGLALDVYQNQNNDRNSHYFARELLYTGRYRSAIKEFERHIAMNAWQPERSQSYVLMGECYYCLGEKEKAIECFQKAFNIDASRREPLIRLAQVAQDNHDPLRAVCYTKAALEIPMSNFYANNAAHYRHVPHELLMRGLFALGRKDEAKKHFDMAFCLNPSNPSYLLEAENFYKWPTLSLIIPTLGRDEGLSRLMESIHAMEYPPNFFEIIVLDKEEPTVPQKVAEGLRMSRGEYKAYLSNDTVLEPNTLKIAILSSMVRKKGLVALHSEEVLPDKGNICTHFVIQRDLVEKIGGEIFDTDFHHVGVDNLLWAKCAKIEEAYHEEYAKISHNHFSKGFPMDEVYKRGWKHVEKDRALLKEKLANL